jgi:hypothetical protein
MAEKLPPSPQKILLKKRVKILKNALPPLKICESVTLTKYLALDAAGYFNHTI